MSYKRPCWARGKLKVVRERERERALCFTANLCVGGEKLEQFLITNNQ
jgi:hypothetical protein